MVRLNTNIFRTRVTLWGSTTSTIFLLVIGTNSWRENDLKATTLALSFAFIFGILSLIAFKTYKEKIFRLDMNRWKNRSAWKDKGIKSKLEVISDWIIN